MKLFYVGFLVGAIAHRTYSIYKVFTGEQYTTNNTIYLVLSFFILSMLFYLLNNYFQGIPDKC